MEGFDTDAFFAKTVAITAARKSEAEEAARAEALQFFIQLCDSINKAAECGLSAVTVTGVASVKKKDIQARFGASFKVSKTGDKFKISW